MNANIVQASAFADSKRHYEILDGLRGVAALLVVAFHIFETFSIGNHLTLIINHGYLAVDFFFILSGFVIGYAYDDRWGKMTLGAFFKRRLIRLHPMIILAMIIGAIGFYFSGTTGIFKIIETVPVWKMLCVMFLGFTLIPLPVPMDIRGWSEMHPLNGAAWSLFFEYVANILYALFIRKFSKTMLAILVFIAGCTLVHFAITGPNGDVVGGWSLTPRQLQIGFTRLMYPFFAGLLLSRTIRPGTVNNAFLWCSLLLLTSLAAPRIGDQNTLWMNGLYESLVIIFIFPLIVYMGASGKIEGRIASKVCRFLGDISYPIYITHYPFIYVYTAWVVDNDIPITKALPLGGLIFIASILLAWASLKLYDIPARKWLTKKFMPKS